MALLRSFLMLAEAPTVPAMRLLGELAGARQQQKLQQARTVKGGGGGAGGTLRGAFKEVEGVYRHHAMSAPHCR